MPTDSAIHFRYKKVGGETYRPIIAVDITYDETIRYEVLVDSGADLCIFDAEVAEAIGIHDLSSGEEFKFGGVTGKQEIAYKHTVALSVKGCKYQTKVAFSSSIHQDGVGIVGQKGFFDRFSVKFDYPEKTIVLRKKDWA